MISFMDWIFDKKMTSNLYKLLLGCDDPSPIIEELWFYYITDMDPEQSPTFKEYAVKYILLSITANFQQKDNDLSKKALLVGNVPEKELDFLDLKGGF